MGNDTELLNELNKQQKLEHLEESSETNQIVKRTLPIKTAITIATISTAIAVVLMGLWQWNIGYTISKKLGTVPSDALSGAEMYGQVKDEIEINHLLRGLIRDNVDDLNKAKNIQRIRTNGELRGADFAKDLGVIERTQFIQAAYSLQQVKTLEWVKNQPNWNVGLTKDVANLVIKGPNRYAGKTAKDWRVKYYALKEHHHAAEHDNDYAELKIVKNELDISQSKLNAALAFIHDNPYYYNKVDLNHLGEKWENYYKVNLDKAPNLKEYLFKKEQSTTQTK